MAKFIKVRYSENFIEQLLKHRHIKLIIDKKISKYRLQEYIEKYMPGYKCFGIDEVNIFALAGPVYAAGVRIRTQDSWVEGYKLNNPERIKGVKDSKLLTRKQIEKLYHEILSISECSIVSRVFANEIKGDITIQKAGHLARLRVANTIERTGYDINKVVLLVDYYPIPEFKGYSIGVLYGDQNTYCISCASIVAKHCCNEYMNQAAKMYPEYSWDTNCGAPTKQHYEAIKKYGLTPLHRKDFCKKFPQLRGA